MAPSHGFAAASQREAAPAGRPPPMARPRSEAQRGSARPAAMRSTQHARVGARPGVSRGIGFFGRSGHLLFRFSRRDVTVLAAIVLLCGIGFALFGIVALGEWGDPRWYGGEMPVGGII